MATTGNKDLAFAEAKRRAIIFDRSYAIYQHRVHNEDHIWRPTEAAAPAAAHWRHIATIQPDGTQSFGA